MRAMSDTTQQGNKGIWRPITIGTLDTLTPTEGDYHLHTEVLVNTNKACLLRLYNVSQGTSVAQSSLPGLIGTATLSCFFTANGLDAYRLGYAVQDTAQDEIVEAILTAFTLSKIA